MPEKDTLKTGAAPETPAAPAPVAAPARPGAPAPSEVPPEPKAPPEAPPSFAVEELSKRYALPRALRGGGGHVQALREVSFSLGPGLYGLLGPNGAGKSTLLNIVTGSLPPDEGRVLWRGRPAGRLGRRFRAELGYMPQQQGLYPAFTGRRFLRYLCALKEIPAAAVADEVARAAAEVNLTDALDRRISGYSGGMKQRLLAASALLGDPKLLILDEPTAGLDPSERVRLRRLLARRAQRSVVLVATHVVSDVESVADGILLLRGGQLADMAPPARLIEKYAPGGTLEDVYLSIFSESEAP